MVVCLSVLASDWPSVRGVPRLSPYVSCQLAIQLRMRETEGSGLIEWLHFFFQSKHLTDDWISLSSTTVSHDL